MTFELGRRDISRIGQVPLSRQLADRLERAIHDGELKPGDALPAEAQIGSTLGVSRTVIRDAMAQLVRDGLITKQPGAVSRVAEPRRIRKADASRFVREIRRLKEGGEHPDTSAFIEEHNAPWSSYTVDVDYRKTKANPADAEFLEIEISTPVQRRLVVKYLDDEPVQIQRSTVPFSIAEGTILADPDSQPYPGGTLAELWEAGYKCTEVRERIRSRMPTAEERDQLQMVNPEPVFDITRIFYDAELPVEASRVIVSAATNELSYRTNWADVYEKD